MKSFTAVVLSIFFVSVLGCMSDAGSYTRYVDPKIGTGGHGHVFVGANVPFGMVQLGPTSIPQQWDWCSGYHESDSTIIGFSHTHLSGTGIGDLFDITVMPVTGDSLIYSRGYEGDSSSGLWSYADRNREVSKPGYYSVPLVRYGITAEMTATCRVGLHRYTFPESDKSGIVIDLMNGGCWDRPMDAYVERIDPQTGLPSEEGTALGGYRFSRGWADDQKVYFYAEFSKPFDSLIVQNRNVQVWKDEFRDMSAYTHAYFGTADGEQVMMKVAISPVSVEGAYAGMQMELPGWNFEKVRNEADRLWNKELGKIRVKTSDLKTLRIFYTSMFHAMTTPSIFCDINGKYRGADGKVHDNPGYDTYTTFSLWDTYRTAMPLYSIFQPERYADFINTMLAICSEQGKLPVWHLHGCETDCMVGNPGIPPVADAVVKNIRGIDQELAFEAMKVSAMRTDRGQDLRMKYGYIPCDLFKESVAYELEYALADGALANAAAALAKKTGQDVYDSDCEYFTERSRSYRHLFDADIDFIRGKDSRGRFRAKYSPFASVHRSDDYCEGNGWQYTWLVPHDFKGLTECFGGQQALISKLDSLFTVPSMIEGTDTSPDISGLIGQYAHGNEPSHHILYLYTMAGQPWKTAVRVREVLETLYSDAPDGLAGNEDVGQMSSWYILSSLGFYQVEPGSSRYWFGSPLFDEAEIDVEGGTFRLKTKNNSRENIYIQKVTLDGKEYTKAYIDYADITSGGELIVYMGAEPNIWY